MDRSRLTRFIIIGAGAAFVLILILSSSIFYTVGNGERGVIFKRFGGGLDKEHVIEEGFHAKAPWDIIYIYDVKKQEVEETMEVLSSNGLEIKVDVSIRYKPIIDSIGFLHNTIGSEYLQRIIIPEMRSATRKVIGKYTPEELYSSKRNAIQNEILSNTQKVLHKNYIDLDALLIRSVTLPQTIKSAIESKLKQEQIAQEYEFRIIREEKEAERKRIEAQGIQDFQRIVSKGIDENLLKWKGIEATIELGKSPNSKIVIIGQGDEGLPLILGGDK